MKRILCAILAVLLLGMMLAGCGPADSESNLVYISKKGQVQTVDVEEFDKSYYSEEDFKTFAQEAIDAYNKAIAKGRQVAFTYNSYGADKKLHPRRNREYIVNPYCGRSKSLPDCLSK